MEPQVSIPAVGQVLAWVGMYAAVGAALTLAVEFVRRLQYHYRVLSRRRAYIYDFEFSDLWVGMWFWPITLVLGPVMTRGFDTVMDLLDTAANTAANTLYVTYTRVAERPCSDCGDRGWLLCSQPVGRGGESVVKVERCDTCKKYASDAEASEAWLSQPEKETDRD